MKKATTTNAAASSATPKATKKAATTKKATSPRKAAAKTKAAAPGAPAAAPEPVAAVAPRPPAAPAVPLAPVQSVRASAPAATEIYANVDVGFGNTLYIRGEGPGLSWDRGVPMNCTKDDLWSFCVASSARPIVFKFLLNDETWCVGDDYVVEPGRKITLVPTF